MLHIDSHCAIMMDNSLQSFGGGTMGEVCADTGLSLKPASCGPPSWRDITIDFMFSYIFN